MEPNLTYVYPHTRIQSLVSILRTTVYHAFPVVTENRDNEKEFMKGNILISNNIKFKVHRDMSPIVSVLNYSILTTRWCKWSSVSLSSTEMIVLALFDTLIIYLVQYYFWVIKLFYMVDGW